MLCDIRQRLFRMGKVAASTLRSERMPRVRVRRMLMVVVVRMIVAMMMRMISVFAIWR